MLQINKKKNNINSAPFISLCLDESIDITKSARLAVFARYCVGNIIKEELIAITSLLTTTKVTDICTAVRNSLAEKEIDLKKIVSVTTDGAPNMVKRVKNLEAICFVSISDLNRCLPNSVSLQAERSRRKEGVSARRFLRTRPPGATGAKWIDEDGTRVVGELLSAKSFGLPGFSMGMTEAVFQELGKWPVVKIFEIMFGSWKIIAKGGLLATDHVILNHGQVTWTTPELAPPSPNYHTTPT
ncbi:general transcription factor II-I repeat domain-containing protein 2A [Trichonephila clavipes]|nr:general transcription factor II-I repeat domain-containing protein 2A [Trichonephila clavipes]